MFSSDNAKAKALVGMKTQAVLDLPVGKVFVCEVPTAPGLGVRSFAVEDWEVDLLLFGLVVADVALAVVDQQPVPRIT